MLDLQKCKADFATLEMNITIASHKDLDNKEEFNKDLEKQGNLQLGAIKMSD